MKRRRSKQYENEESVELEQLLAVEQNAQWTAETEYVYEEQDVSVQNAYSEVYQEGYEDFYSEEYSEEHEAVDSETRFHIAMGVFDLISIIIGIVVILVLVGMLVTLFNWLRTDILHSALFLQSGLQ